MSTLGRYLGREIAGAVLFVLIGFLALFAFFDFIDELEEVGRGGYRLQHALAFILLGLPSHVYELMPIAALIGTIYALAQFASNYEFTAMRAAGLGRAHALGELAKVGIVLALATAVVGEVLAPPAERLAQSLRLSALGTTVSGSFRSGLWIKDAVRDAQGAVDRQRFVNVGELLPDTRLAKVRVFEFDREFRLRQILLAEGGRFTPPQAWTLEGVEALEFRNDARARELLTVAVDRRRYPSISWTSELTPDIVGVLMIDPERMSAWSLAQYVSHLRDNQQSAERYEIALWRKVVYPVAVLVMMALALPFGYLQVRAGGIGYKVFAGIMLGVAFHFLNGLFSHLGLLNMWAPWLAASIPSIGAFLIALAMLAWVDRAR